MTNSDRHSHNHSVCSTAWLVFTGMAMMLAWPGGASAQIVFNQLDDFQNMTVHDWSEGANTPNPPTNISSGGPNGASDAYMQNISTGGFGAGAKMIMFNTVQWTGNYVTAGVNRITAHMANFGSTPLHMRVAIQSATGTVYGSTTAQLLPADGQWYVVTFNLTASNMSLIQGAETLNQTLQNVIQLRILSAQLGPSFTGDAIVGTLGVDNIRATTAPPTVSAVQVNDGSAQRSMVTSIRVTFSQTVALAGNPFTLSRSGPGSPTGNVNLTMDLSQSTANQTIAILTFSGSLTEFNSLRDGRYDLTISAAAVTGPGGQLDGDGNGAGGDNFVVIGNPATNKLFRLFGDADGDGNVAANDFIQFRLALGGNNPIFDFDNDGAVAASDFIQFRLRFGGSI